MRERTEDAREDTRKKCDNHCTYYHVETVGGNYCEIGTPSCFISESRPCSYYRTEPIKLKSHR